MPGLPYEDIREERDRRWSLRVLKRLAFPCIEPAEVLEITDTLIALDDPRTWEPLTEMVKYRRHLDGIRRAASDALMEMRSPHPGKETLQQWWTSQDRVLQRHALRLMGAELPEILAQVAADSAHPLQADALWWMEGSFEQPRHQEIKTAALSHPEPRVRKAAAWVLLWDEPVKAEEPLLHALSDASSMVAQTACDTLRYYPGQRVYRELLTLTEHTDEDLAQVAEDVAWEIKGTFLRALTHHDPRVRKHIRAWMNPIWDSLGVTDDDLTPEEPSEPVERLVRRVPVALDKVLELLSDADASVNLLEHTLRRLDWNAFAPGERKFLTEVLLLHEDPYVREWAAPCFGAWQDVDHLLQLLQDGDGAIRKTAMHWLGKVNAPEPAIAHVAWDHLEQAMHPGTYAQETLKTYLAHAPAEEALPRLLSLVRDESSSDAVRALCVEKLASSKDAITGLMDVLEDPPRVSWAPHIQLLRAVHQLNLPRPELRQLREVDHLHVQVALAPLL